LAKPSKRTALPLKKNSWTKIQPCDQLEEAQARTEDLKPLPRAISPQRSAPYEEDVAQKLESRKPPWTTN
jgi:hypothetical protein